MALQKVGAMKLTGMEEADVNKVDRVLTSEQIEEFHRRGVLVVKNFLYSEEVVEARKGKLCVLSLY
jgi:hypothetical protein